MGTHYPEFTAPASEKLFFLMPVWSRTEEPINAPKLAALYAPNLDPEKASRALRNQMSHLKRTLADSIPEWRVIDLYGGDRGWNLSVSTFHITVVASRLLVAEANLRGRGYTIKVYGGKK